MKFRPTVIYLSLISVLLFLTACNSLVFLPSGSHEKNPYPSTSITGVIPWGAGGSTDSLARAITPLVEEELGQSIVLTNKPGGSSAIGTHYVHKQGADGYHLLFSAENPALYGVLDISDLGFEDFDPISIYARGIATVVVPADSPYQTLDDLLRDAKARPGKVKMGSTGPGGLPFVVGTMINSAADTEFNMIPFDGDGPALTALLGGHLDASVTVLSAAINNAEAGKVRILTVVNDKPVEELPNVPPITQSLPELEKHLPWGPFFGVWVKKDTPEPVKEKLIDAFSKAEQDQTFQSYLDNMKAVPMNLHGEEAVAYWREWQSTTAWLIHDDGAAKIDPVKLNIPRKQMESESR
ncbi:Bug family tripartite tricarboxylate transporter substrate binding protein [Desmospora activa]|uniref:Tripartite-type tricarboxylate transporter receptor subunit TctC n=1 Tax=Desmospora activa DSM 45169 TaxID=1121389 RepID=A0A2T4Z954_9BACL|nr:tripartite tricarboxylate transporter substrate binding protein [Desmospora activa]PTM58423.1 tripartite-type tricarboxylate transporter receptor subunit TctC [Desmospora activa DSM 45169]